MNKPPGNADTTAPFLMRHDFLIRRLHSLSGLIPVGAYMCIHLLTNAGVLNGARSFQKSVDAIHSLGVALPFVEWTFIFLPILFHAVVGVFIIRSGQSNTTSYAYVGNVRYYLQRATAWIALVFIFFHVFQLHGWIRPVAHRFSGGQFSPLFATSSAADALQRGGLVIEIFYIVGVLSCVFHLANGLWTMGITWGVWTTAAAQRRANYVCGAFGILLASVGIGAMYGMFTVDVREAFEIEEKINAEKVAAGEVTAEEVNAEKPALRGLEPNEPPPAKAEQAVRGEPAPDRN